MGLLVAYLNAVHRAQKWGTYLRVAPRVDATLLSIREGVRRIALQDAAQMGRGLASMPSGIPESYFAGKAFEDFATKFPGLKDVQREPAYAFKAYPAAVNVVPVAIFKPPPIVVAIAVDAAAVPESNEGFYDVEQLERQAIARVLADTRRNLAEAARRLKISRKTLYEKIHLYGL